MVGNNTLKWVTLGVYGGGIYFFIEVLYKSIVDNGNGIHWSMYIVGLLCFLSLGMINEFVLTENMPLYIQCGIATLIILCIEFISGVIVNLWLGWNVWHYDRYHIMHQVSLIFGIYWYFLSAFGIWLDDKLREKLFGEKPVKYKIFKR